MVERQKTNNDNEQQQQEPVAPAAQPHTNEIIESAEAVAAEAERAFLPEHDLYDLEVVLPGPVMQGDIMGLDYMDNATADRLYAYSVISVFSARVGSAESQSFTQRRHGSGAQEEEEASAKGWKRVAVEDQDIVEYLDRYLFQEYHDTHQPVELNPFVLFSLPQDIQGMRMADAAVSRNAPYQLRSPNLARKLASRWHSAHPQLGKAVAAYDRFAKPASNPIAWIASLFGMGGFLVGAMLAVTGAVLMGAAVVALSAAPVGYMGWRLFGFLTRGMAARQRLAKAVLAALNAELSGGFPTSDNEVSLYPGFAVKVNITREHAQFREMIAQEEYLAHNTSNSAVNQVFALARRLLNRIAGRGTVTSGLIMLCSSESNLNVVVPRIVADTISGVPQYHYNDPSFRSGVFGIVMRPWLLSDLPFTDRYTAAAARCTDSRWARRNPLPEHGLVRRPQSAA